MSPSVARILRPVMVGFGASIVVSAAVNIFAAVQLIEPADETMIGLTRTEMIRSFVAFSLIGVAMIYLGLRWTRPVTKPDEPPRL